MKFKSIASLLGWSEEPANASEGIYLQTEEATSIDAALENAAVTTASLNTANDLVNTLQAENTQLSSDISAKDNRITELEGEVAALKDKPSGSGTKLKAVADETEQSSGKTHVRYDDPSHPANIYAGTVKKYDSGLKK